VPASSTIGTTPATSVACPRPPDDKRPWPRCPRPRPLNPPLPSRKRTRRPRRRRRRPRPSSRRPHLPRL